MNEVPLYLLISKVPLYLVISKVPLYLLVSEVPLYLLMSEVPLCLPLSYARGISVSAAILCVRYPCICRYLMREVPLYLPLTFICNYPRNQPSVMDQVDVFSLLLSWLAGVNSPLPD